MVGVCVWGGCVCVYVCVCVCGVCVCVCVCVCECAVFVPEADNVTSCCLALYLLLHSRAGPAADAGGDDDTAADDASDVPTPAFPDYTGLRYVPSQGTPTYTLDPAFPPKDISVM